MIKKYCEKERRIGEQPILFLSQNVHNRLQIVQLLIGGNGIYWIVGRYKDRLTIRG